MMTPTALGPVPIGNFQGSQVQAAAAPGGVENVASQRRQQAEPGVIENSRSGAQVDRAAQEGTIGRVSDGDAASNAQQKPNGEELAPEDLEQIQQLEQTDREVRQHELAHQVAGGPYTGSPSFDYEVGPDGQRYAVAGRVSVDYGAVTGDPSATVEKMKTVIAAALAPADPSSQDLQVASRARQTLLSARLEVSEQRSQQMAANDSGQAAAGGAGITSSASTSPGAGANTSSRETSDSSASGPARDPRVAEYDQISAATGATSGAGGRAVLRAVA